MKAVQAMLLQSEGDKIFLLPAWTADWNADFKLHAPQQTIVEATVRADRIVALKIAPETRRKAAVLSPHSNELARPPPLGRGDGDFRHQRSGWAEPHINTSIPLYFLSRTMPV